MASNAACALHNPRSMTNKCVGLLALSAVSLTACASETEPNGAYRDGAQVLQDAAGPQIPVVGTAIRIQGMSDPQYRAHAAEHYNQITVSNALKWQATRPDANTFDFEDADEIIDWASAEGLGIRGHTLVWGNFLPAWMNESLGQAGVEQQMRTHIQTLVGQYAGQIEHWDVVNEAIDNGGNVRNELFTWAMGPDYIAVAFHEAHAADPDAKLLYNDFGTERPGPKQDGVYALIDSLLDDGVPVHEVGIQMHVQPDQWHSGSAADLADAIESFGSLGVDVYITELDVRLDELAGPWEQRLELQKEIYHAVASTCFEEPACRGVTTWGFTDAHHYLPTSAAALPFDESYAPKPAFEGLLNGLQGLPLEITSCPLPGSVFCDPLEPSTFDSLWKVQVGGGEVSSTNDAYKGLSAAQAQIPGTTVTRRAYTSAPVSGLGSQIWTRAYLYVANPSVKHFTAVALDEPGAPWHGVSMGSLADGRAFVRVAGSPAKRAIGPALPRNRWVCVEMRIDVANSGGKAALYLDGSKVAEVKHADTQMTADYGAYKAGIIWADTNSGPLTVRFDEIAVGPTRLGCD